MVTGGWGAEVAALLGEHAFYHLDAPITRVAAPDTLAPAAPVLEQEYLPSVERVIGGALARGWQVEKAREPGVMPGSRLGQK